VVEMADSDKAKMWMPAKKGRDFKEWRYVWQPDIRVEVQCVCGEWFCISDEYYDVECPNCGKTFRITMNLEVKEHWEEAM